VLFYWRIDLEENGGNWSSTELGDMKKPRSGWRSFLVETLQTIVLAIVMYFLIDTVVARVRVDNISMIPTLQPGEFVLVNKISYRLSDVKRGDIIVFHYPLNPQEDYIKRVIGLPGDDVNITNGQLFVNGQEINESYISVTMVSEGDWVVPQDALFVMGDNRNQSSDSRAWGFVPMENLVGKAMVIYWPLDEFRVLSHPDVVNAANNAGS
jgi:signal peptidase I